MSLTALSAVIEYNNITDEFDIEVLSSKSESIETFDHEFVASEIKKRILSANRVVFHTDYDADGIMSAAIANLHFPGAPIFVPEREDGYGVSGEFVKGLLPGDLLITADCGIKSRREIALSPDGVDVIVTDHHIPSENLLPECTVINPLLYSGVFGGYSGASVLMLVLESALGPIVDSAQYAAIGAICDVMPMVGPNRKIVRDGIGLMARRPTEPIRALCKASGVYTAHITPDDIGWKIGPAINAAGRMGDAKSALDLFCATEGFDTLAERLVQYNTERKRVVGEIIGSLSEKNVLLDEDYIRVLRVDVPAGFVGLVASSVSKQEDKCVMVLTGGSSLSGSLRSNGSISCVDVLGHCAEYIGGYGGHSGAAGFSMREENLNSLLGRLSSVERVKVPHGSEAPQSQARSIECHLQEAVNIAGDLDDFAPYGNGFLRPVFVSSAVVSNVKSIGSGGLHSSFAADGVRCVMFNRSSSDIASGSRNRIVYTPKINRFRGTADVQLEVFEIRREE